MGECLPVTADMQRTADWLTTTLRQGKDYFLSNCVSNLAFNWMRRISIFQLEIDTWEAPGKEDEAKRFGSGAWKIWSIWRVRLLFLVRLR